MSKLRELVNEIVSLMKAASEDEIDETIDVILEATDDITSDKR